MKNKVDVTVIIPVHTVNVENFDTLIANAVKSIDDNRDALPARVIFVAPSNEENILARISTITTLDKEYQIDFLTNPNDTDFASQMNFAVANVTTEYFSLLEMDDEYSNLWFRNVEKYIKEFPDVAIFLPIISDVSADGKYLGYTNEVAWAYEFTDKHGYVDHGTMKEYPNFNPDGMVMKTAEFKRIGGYKSNIKLTFNLEFLLRASDQALPIFVIPKIGYKHVNMRPHSIFWEYRHGEKPINSDEADFWLEAAQKEYYYIDDRHIEYTPKKPEENKTI